MIQHMKLWVKVEDQICPASLLRQLRESRNEISEAGKLAKDSVSHLFPLIDPK